MNADAQGRTRQGTNKSDPVPGLEVPADRRDEPWRFECINCGSRSVQHEGSPWYWYCKTKCGRIEYAIDLKNDKRVESKAERLDKSDAKLTREHQRTRNPTSK